MNIKENKNVLINISNTFMQKIMMVVFVVSSIAFLGIINPTEIKAQEICDKETKCEKWSDWYYKSTSFSIPSQKHWPDRTFGCPITVVYKWRECDKCAATKQHMVQYEILTYIVDLSYKIWVFPIGWVWPCREAIDLLKGSSSDVSLKNNELLDNIFKKLVINEFDIFRKGIPPNIRYARCDDTDPTNNYNGPPIKLMAKKGSCWGACRVQSPQKIIVIDSWKFEIKRPSLAELAELYDVPLEGENAIRIADLTEDDMIELNHYIQKEINPYIVEEDFKLKPFLTLNDAIILMTPIQCTTDFCCIYELTLCIDKNNNTVIHENRYNSGQLPCTGDPDNSKCPKGENRVLYPCEASCK